MIASTFLALWRCDEQLWFALPIKRTTEMHGGRIWVEFVEGQGSTFSFSLPIRGEQQIKLD